MDRGAWYAAVHGVTKSQTRLSNYTLTFHFHALEMEMATHSSVLAWRIPGMEEPGRLLAMGSHRVGTRLKRLSSSSSSSSSNHQQYMRASVCLTPFPVLSTQYVYVCVFMCACVHMSVCERETEEGWRVNLSYIISREHSWE